MHHPTTDPFASLADAARDGTLWRAAAVQPMPTGIGA